MSYLFTSESVSAGHPDKVADQISDALLDEFLRQDPESKVACETLVTTGLTIVAGEVKTNGYVDIQSVVRKTIREIGYNKAEYRFDADSCGVLSAIHEQSQDINQGVVRQAPEEQGAGDQGMMFGYACNEMDNFMPISSELAHIFLQDLHTIRKEGKVMTYLRPDSKSQITLEYAEDGNPLKINTIVVSTQHNEFNSQKEMQTVITKDVNEILIPRVLKVIPERAKLLFAGDWKLFVNPTGNFVIGGPHGDTGLTGRKIIVDTYGGHAAHGGGAFSGKDSSKVDRSAAYAMRHIAKNLVASGLCSKVLVQVAYAIGVAQPVNLFVNTFDTCKNPNLTDSEIAQLILNNVDLCPFAIINRFGLKYPIFEATATYGHFGRDFYQKEVELAYPAKGSEKVEKENGETKYLKKVDFFAWEKLDLEEKFKVIFLQSVQ
ncbi:MAG: methionine adenosyltransferase [Bacteroidales bacterium]|jgi:S-adenosylmethionine synthetase|nr:methionine adenosyltransferase [Bacteroidales bacterium]